LPFDNSTGIRRLVRPQRDGVGGHDIGTVEEIRDAPEALGLALRKEIAAGYVQARQGRVLSRIARAFQSQFKRVGNIAHRQTVLSNADIRMRAPVQRCANEFHLLAEQLQRCRRRGIRVTAQAHGVAHYRAFGDEIEFERDGINQECGRRVVGAADYGRCGRVGHGGSD
jgi:hypothetical protein